MMRRSGCSKQSTCGRMMMMMMIKIMSSDNGEWWWVRRDEGEVFEFEREYILSLTQNERCGSVFVCLFALVEQVYCGLHRDRTAAFHYL